MHVINVLPACCLKAHTETTLHSVWSVSTGAVAHCFSLKRAAVINFNQAINGNVLSCCIGLHKWKKLYISSFADCVYLLSIVFLKVGSPHSQGQQIIIRADEFGWISWGECLVLEHKAIASKCKLKAIEVIGWS